MTNITNIALEVDKIAAFVHEDPFELFRAATSGERIMVIHDDAVDEIEKIIASCSKFDLARIDRIVFDHATGQA
jgi:hydrogenase maturation factor